uniref:MOY n=1 Tax=Rhagoletis zephyria TaxID=28612 RepID=A0A5B8H9K1_RHAZE|nr:MOY [Rhagoletis zephyria]
MNLKVFLVIYMCELSMFIYKPSKSLQPKFGGYVEVDRSYNFLLESDPLLYNVTLSL